MVDTYPICRGAETVGQATVIKEGLYYYFDCRCELTGEIMFRIVVQSGEDRENLGIAAPRNGAFGLTAKIPVSHFREFQPIFFLMPRHEKMAESFLPLSPEEPFAYLKRLEQAYLVPRGTELGIGFRQA